MIRKIAATGACLVLAGWFAACAPKPAPTESADTVSARTMNAILTELSAQSRPTPTVAPSSTFSPSPNPTVTHTPTIVPTVDLKGTPIGITPVDSEPTGPTPTTDPNSLKTRTLVGKCNAAFFQDDITIADYSAVKANTPFTKTWAIRNYGFCTWDRRYRLKFFSGQHMNGPNEINFPEIVAPNQSTWLSVNLIAPKSVGVHLGRWYMYGPPTKDDPDGDRFGVGIDGDEPLIVRITVVL